ncbi:hypothetical protein EON64_04495 [archaeon]|nr:MAG: hypothetical protein EON64_04495 [archaeon]
MAEDKVTLRSAEKNVLAGGIAGCVAKTMTAPLSRMTVLYQVGPLLNSKANTGKLTRIGLSDSLLKTSMDIVRREGVLSLWRGNFTSAVIHRFPYSAIQFSTYEALKTVIVRHTDTHHDSALIRFVCGSLSGAVSVVTCYPLDIVRTRLIVAAPSSSGPRMSSRIVNIMRDIVRREGVRGLYRGLGATLGVTVPTLGIGFAVYGQVKERLLEQGGIFLNPATGHLSPVGALLSGSVSGVVSASTTFPGDVVRKRMQVMGAMIPSHTSTTQLMATETKSIYHQILSLHPLGGQSGEGAAGSAGASAEAHAQHLQLQGQRGFFFHLRDIMRKEGLRGLYRGILPEVLKVCPTVGVMFCTYEYSRDLLDQVF